MTGSCMTMFMIFGMMTFVMMVMVMTGAVPGNQTHCDQLNK